MGKREDRDDQKACERVQQRLESRSNRYAFSETEGSAANFLSAGLDQIIGYVVCLLLGQKRQCRCHQPHGHTGNGGVHSRPPGRVPDDRADYCVDRRSPDLDLAQETKAQEERDGQAKPSEREIVGIENRDDRYGTNVIDDR